MGYNNNYRRNSIKKRVNITFVIVTAVIVLLIAASVITAVRLTSGNADKQNVKTISGGNGKMTTDGTEILPIFLNIQHVPKFLPPVDNSIIDFSNGVTNRENVKSIGEEIYSDYAVLVKLTKDENENDRYEVLAQKSPDSRCYPASLTKTLTVITALDLAQERNISLDERYLFSEELFAPLSEASMAGFKPGEDVRLIDLMYGAMLPSGAEATVALGNFFSGSEAAFAEEMNKKAVALGLKNSHFLNTSGLHQDGHYSTARELTAILLYALKNPIFKKIFTTADEYHVPKTNVQEERTILGTFWKNVWGDEDPKFRIIGAKTGFTDQAGQCLSTLAVKNGVEYVALTCHAALIKDVNRPQVKDAFTLYADFAVN